MSTAYFWVGRYPESARAALKSGEFATMRAAFGAWQNTASMPEAEELAGRAVELLLKTESWDECIEFLVKCFSPESAGEASLRVQGMMIRAWASSEALVHGRNRGVSDYLAETYLRDTRPKPLGVNERQIGAAFERAGRVVDCLAFYERLDREQGPILFAAVRWVKCKARQATLPQNKDTEAGMFLAGEEFADQDDLFDQYGKVSQNGGKQIDPVNYGRLTAGPPGPNDTEQSNPDAFRGDMRRRIFAYVRTLINFRTSTPALSVNDTNFIWTDFNDNKRVIVWQRGIAGTAAPVIVLANFSDFYSAPGTDYVIPTWPQPTPAGKKWREVTQGRDVDPAYVGREEWHQDKEVLG